MKKILPFQKNSLDKGSPRHLSSDKLQHRPFKFTSGQYYNFGSQIRECILECNFTFPNTKRSAESNRPKSVTKPTWYYT